MSATFASLMAYLAAGRTARRRARNLRLGITGTPRLRLAAPPAAWTLLGCAAALLGAVVLAQAARGLPPGTTAGGADAARLDLLRPLLGGVTLRVPQEAGITVQRHGPAALVVGSGMRLAAPLRIDLCAQLPYPEAKRILPLPIGQPFGTAKSAAAPVRTVLLAAPGSAMPRMELSGAVDGALRLAWDAGAGSAAWAGDAGPGVSPRGSRATGLLGRAGWLVWEGGALRFTRRATSACPQAGELLLQRVLPDPQAGGLVQAFGPGLALPLLQLAPGSHQVPAAAPRGLEDARLFAQLQERGLVRLGTDGLAEIAPRDLAAWQAAAPSSRAPLPGWEHLHLDEGGRRLLERLYYRADGAFVREQLRVFNSERRLLAWRVRAGGQDRWQASAGAAPVREDGGLPVAAMRLFARLPQGWEPWRRIGAWEGAAASARLSLDDPPAQPVELLVAGRLLDVRGAVASASPACDGRACRDRDAVQLLRLAPLPGARRIELELAPLDLAALTGGADAAYRHLRTENGRLAWQALPDAGMAPRAVLAEVRLQARDGAALWQAGAPSAAAQAAGLAPLLGLRPDHSASVAGMLGRLPGRAHAARLSLDLGLQAAAQAVLDCVGLRQGHWEQGRCHDAQAAPAGRQAGLVLLDAASGELLAAAGAGTGGASTDPARWPELRDFDRAEPARSPLRLPAFQHDGGAGRAPGSTFKVVTALGLEAAARTDRALDRLLDGLPLAELDARARAAGYGFASGAPSYPSGAAARITNFREQEASARAAGGRLGLAQALTHSINTWFAWTAELGDRSLGGGPQGGVPGVRELEPGALDSLRPLAGMARRLGFGSPLRLDGGLLPADYPWSSWDALQASPAQLDPILTRHEVRQMAIGLRMQATPLQMALVAAAVGQGRTVAPRLLLELDGRVAAAPAGEDLGVRLDRIRAGMKGVVEHGTAASAFRGPAFDRVRAGLFGKTGTAPTGKDGEATVWFMGWLEPGSLPGQDRRLAFAVFVSASQLTGGGHAAPVVAALLRSMPSHSPEQKGN
ncbi:hypothetical protein LE190_10155 [Massilia oculi]|uniref:Penicillin-binding protein transpeptidase domain-containing protein n=1 Tax=Massilia hydrophila TaxID=3044279 RepID=A0ABS7YB10_9BURK|nr:penicillin-binding transpeptidase domain-containing protein [Massilia oculi]MCA1856287.1 hypothetical protein [Massilia oculi]